MPPLRANKNGMKKEKLDFKMLKKLFKYGKKYRFAIIVSMLFAVIGAVCTIIGPGKISDLVEIIQNGIFAPIDMNEVVTLCVTLLSIYAAGAVLSYFQQFITTTITQKTSKQIRSDINNKINKIPLNYFDTTTRGDILSTVTNDVDTLSQSLGSSIANLVSAAALFIGTIIMMFVTNWILAFLTIGISIVGFIIMFIILGISQKYFNKKQVDLAIMNGQIEEVFSNHKIVRIFAGAKGEKLKFNKVNVDLYNDNWKSQALGGMMRNIMNFVGNITYALIFIVGVVFIIEGNELITLGTITSFIIYARLFSQPLSTFSQSMTSLQQASAASKRVFGLLEQEELENEDHKELLKTDFKGDVVFENVRFGYEEDKEIIHGFSANIKSGQKVAIIGPTGSGKTTLVNLLMRFYEVNSGDIKIDNISIKDMKREDVHNLFDMILQDTWLFKGTIRENLIYNNEEISDEKLNEIMNVVGLKHFIEMVPNGYDTIIDDNINISEGQKQQLTIARAMVKEAPLLILDEATSNVDTRTELIIQKAMDELTKDRTSFVIAHRLSTIKNADIILVLKDGNVIEQGNHEELMKQNGFYKELYNSQFMNV